MRIAISCPHIYEQDSGFGRYTINMLLTLQKHCIEHTITILCPETNADNKKFSFKKMVAPMRSLQIWNEQLTSIFPLSQFDLLYIPHDASPAQLPPIPYIVTIHDTIPLLLFSKKILRHPTLAKTTSPNEYFAMKKKLALAQQAQKICTVSKFSKKELIAAGIDPEKIAIVNNYIAPSFTPQPKELISKIKQKHNIASQYILFMGGERVRKNLLRTIDAFLQLEDRIKRQLQLVVVGKITTPKIKKLFSKHGKQIVSIGNVTDQDLSALYTGAKFTIFVSLFEGFGLPTIESAACGTPSLIANNSSLPEVAAPHSMQVSPYSTISIKNGISELLTNQGYYQTLVNNCEQAKINFSQQIQYNQLKQIFDQALKKP